MDSPFLSNKKPQAPPAAGGAAAGEPGSVAEPPSGAGSVAVGGEAAPGGGVVAVGLSTRVAASVGGVHNTPRRSAEVRREELGDAPSCSCEVGVVRGEDYTFHFSGSVTDGTLSFRLHMQYEGDDDDAGAAAAAGDGGNRTVDFVYEPDEDTPEQIADEISGEFSLSSTDRDICAAALKEWLAKNAPEPS